MARIVVDELLVKEGKFSSTVQTVGAGLGILASLTGLRSYMQNQRDRSRAQVPAATPGVIPEKTASLIVKLAEKRRDLVNKAIKEDRNG